MALWLKERKVESVAMEGTGVYWIAPHEVLERHGFEVALVNTRELARVPGRKKTDRVDAGWIQRLHSCGLLRGSFRPVEQVCILRTYVRDRSILVAETADWMRRMQKSLDQMNVRVHRAVSDLDGMTGMAILRAIVGGERDAVKLAQLRDRRCRKSEEEIAEQLTGHWREDHLFSLEQALKVYDGLQERIADYDRKILEKVGEMTREERRGQPAPLRRSNLSAVRQHPIVSRVRSRPGLSGGSPENSSGRLGLWGPSSAFGSATFIVLVEQHHFVVSINANHAIAALEYRVTASAYSRRCCRMLTIASAPGAPSPAPICRACSYFR